MSGQKERTSWSKERMYERNNNGPKGEVRKSHLR